MVILLLRYVGSLVMLASQLIVELRRIGVVVVWLEGKKNCFEGMPQKDQIPVRQTTRNLTGGPTSIHPMHFDKRHCSRLWKS